MSTPPYEEAGEFIIRLQDTEYLVPRHCPHRGGRLDHGQINQQRRTVTCPLHKSVFCLETGEQLAGPFCPTLAVSSRPCAGMQKPIAQMSDEATADTFYNRETNH